LHKNKVLAICINETVYKLLKANKEQSLQNKCFEDSKNCIGRQSFKNSAKHKALTINIKELRGNKSGLPLQRPFQV
jgi:hypothetical protein